MKIINLKNYLTAPSKCFVKKCNAICCAEAPIPIDFLPKHNDKVVRKIYEVINFGINDPRDTYESVIFNTTGNPIRVLGIDQNGNKVVGIPPGFLKQLQIKSQEQFDKLLEHYKTNKHYCPFLTNYWKCNVYAERPQICREFGTDPSPINKCPEKVSRLYITKFYTKDFFRFYKELFQKMGKAIIGKKS